jgi:hypothetical protein
MLTLGLAGCAAEIRVPVTGKVGSDTAFGYAIGRLQGDSTFTIDTTKGLRCGGVYNALDQGRSISAPFTCNDGRSGQITITRDRGLTTGTAVAVMPDGTKAQFAFGKDVRYEDRFTASGALIVPEAR